MFGGGNGGFGGGQKNPFGGPTQAAPMNAFSGGGGTTFGGGGAFGNSNNSSNFRASTGTTFGGRGGGGRQTPPRGGRASTRGGRTSGRGRGGFADLTGESVFADSTPTFGGGRGGARAPFSGGRGRGAPGGTVEFGTPTSASRGRGSYEYGTPTSAGRGRGRGSGYHTTSGSDFSAIIGDNPFAPPLPASTGGPGDFNQGSGRGGGRAGGRTAGGRNPGGRTPTTAFGNAATVQPNVRRKSDTGGRGIKPVITAFGQPGVNGFVPPLPPPLPPSPPSTTQFGGRGGAPRAGPTAHGGSTTFGQGASVFAGQGHFDSTGFASDSAPTPENPFATAQNLASKPTGRTTFGRPDSSDSAPAAITTRPKRQSGVFGQHELSTEPPQFIGGLEARISGGRGRSKQGLFPDSQIDQPPQFVARQPKKKTPAADPFASEGPMDGNGSEIPMAMALKPKKKANRATPSRSPSVSPTPGSPVSGTTAFIGDERNKAELASAKNLDGTCVDMCSPKERELHIRVDELSLFEKNSPGKPGMERELIVKRFQRSSADHKLDIPSELRPIGVLRHTQLYLEQQIMDRELLGPDPRFNPPRTPELIELYNFCWDRCRMIRKDFVLQNYRGAGGRVHPIVLDVHERIARYHILSEHELCEVPSFVAQQNMEQLGQTLKSLNELYDESRKVGDPAYLSPFEAEFRGFFILCMIDNGRGSDVLKFVKGLAPQVRESPQVKFAMQVFVARHTQDYYTFFKLLRATTYLQACLMFRWIPSVRSQALERMNRAYRNQPFPMDDLVEALCFDDMDHAESVCSHHGLDVASSEDDTSAVLVNFGGEFESDIQLRQNKNPLPVHSSYYVSQKQGDYLRRDVCRGVTEYPPEGYPLLSKLIEDTEAAERAAMYPDRQPGEDEYSGFAEYTSDPYDIYAPGTDDRTSACRDGFASASYSSHPRTMSSMSDADAQQHDLDEITRKHADIERTKVQMLQRIQQLEREKEEKKRRAQEAEQSSRADEQKSAEEKARAEAATLRAKEEERRQQAEEDAARQRAQVELELQLRKQAEAKKAAAEQARLAEAQRIAEAERRAREEQRQLELRREEEERRRIAAIEAERRRDAERLAEEARAKLEAERRAEIARENARRKHLQRIQKQRLAVLHLKFHQWKKFTSQARQVPQSVKVEVSSLVNGALDSPRDVVGWLFGGNRFSSDIFGVRRRQWKASTIAEDAPQFSQAFWRPLAVTSVTSEVLRSTGHQAPGWKTVIADVMDGGLSSFGSWCAVKLGIESALLDDEERVSTVHVVHPPDLLGITVCCRYLDANFSRTLSLQGQQKKLAGTSAVIVPVDLNHVLDPSILQRWEDRVSSVMDRVHGASRLAVMIVAFCAKTTPRKGDALATVEASVQKIRTKFDSKIAFLDGDLVLEDELFDGRVDEKLANVLGKIASSSAKTEDLRAVEFSDLVDGVVNGALRAELGRTRGLDALQDHLHSELWKLRDALLSPAVIDVDAPIPELQGALVTPTFGWNSRDSIRNREAVIKFLTDHRIPEDAVPIPSSTVCEVYYVRIVKFVDELFSSFAPASAAISTSELKRVLQSLLAPFHAEFIHHPPESRVQDASRLLPWRQIFGEIYGAFVENLGDGQVYIPAKMLAEIMSKSETIDHSGVQASSGRRSRNRSTLNGPAQVAAIEFARLELKRTLSQLIIPPEQVHGIKRLRQEIARDRAASKQFQQFLRRELNKGV